MRYRLAELPRGSSSLQPRLLEVQLALDPPAHFVADLALVAHGQELLALRVEQLVHQPPVRVRALLELDPISVGRGAEPLSPVVVHPPHPLDGVVARPAVAGDLLEPGDRRFRDAHAGADL